MTQIISKDGIDICVTTVPYPAWIIKDMKQAGYKIRVVEDERRTNDQNICEASCRDSGDSVD